MSTTTRPNFSNLKKLDVELIEKLEKNLRAGGRRTPFRNSKVAALSKKAGTPAGFLALQRHLSDKGAFDINFDKCKWKDLDGETRTLTIARAAVTDMWPMGTNLWIRDNAIVGARLLFGPAGKSRSEGKKVLLSALTAMSSVSQLKRFEAIIKSNDKKFRNDPANWPHIFLGIADNLNAAKNEGWAHKQEAFQMVAYYVLEALERGLLSLSELTDKHKKFLSLIIPFQAKLEFWKSENSGSWEEVPALRTSVLAWDLLSIYRLLLVSHDKELSFLAKGFKKYRSFLGKKYQSKDIGECASSIFVEGLKVMMEALPFECPHYGKKDVRYRTADSALIYLLQLNIPNFLAHIMGQDIEWAHGIERSILAQVESLFDPDIGGFYRYGNDTYQRCGFFRHVTVQKLSDMYGGPSGDASKSMGERNRIVPKGRMAAWSHFTWQLSAWAGRCYLQSGEDFYRRKHEFYFSQGLRLITGSKEWSLEQIKDNKVRMIKIPENIMPECYITDVTAQGKEMIFPSPHSPLNWAVVEMADAFFVRRLVLEQGE